LREFGYASLTPRELVEKLARGEDPVLLDVREPWEYERARISGSRLVPLADLGDRLHELDPGAETVVICHHGLRSAHATRFLDHSGFRSVYNLEGGLDAYSAVDGSVPRY
jgi:rhodanese-related sulfurtransferase